MKKAWMLVWVLAMVLSMVVLKNIVSVPDVHKSVSTGEMTLYSPNNPNGIKVTKDQLPDRYTVVWIK